MISFERVAMLTADDSHKWPSSETEALRLQQRLAHRVIREDQMGAVKWVAGVDAGYDERCNERYAAAVVLWRPGPWIWRLGPLPGRRCASPTAQACLPSGMSSDSGPLFARYIGIDYSGAQTPTSSLKGLRIYLADKKTLPMEVPPPPSPRKYWTRRGIAEKLVERLSEAVPTIVGIDHGFSFPMRYSEVHHLLPDWSAFLDDFQRHWPTDEDNTYVDFIRYGTCGNGEARSGDSRWRRLSEERAGSAKSVFHYDVPGSVAKSTHAGIPWLRYLRQRLGDRVHFWPFDGWEIPAGRSTVVEVYPALWRQSFAREGRTADQQDAYAAAAWLRQADLDGRLAEFLNPSLMPTERAVAEVEGWILGVM